MYVRAGQMAAPSCLGRGGKSGLHRTGCWVTPSPGDRRKVPQKIYRQAPNFRMIILFWLNIPYVRTYGIKPMIPLEVWCLVRVKR